MLTVSDIRNVKFSRAVGGYKAEDVDVLLDKIEADYASYERTIKDYELKVETLNSEIEGFKNSQSSIQSVLVSAQKLADQIVNDAKAKSEEIIKQAEKNIENITVREKELSAAFELKAKEQKAALEQELGAMVNSAREKAEVISSGAEETVKRQQMLFDRLKLEIAAFKNDISARYKEHIELLSKLPDSVPGDPKYISEVLSASYDKMFEDSKKKAEEVSSEEEPAAKESVEPAVSGKGFVVETSLAEEDV